MIYEYIFGYLITITAAFGVVINTGSFFLLWFKSRPFLFHRFLKILGKRFNLLTKPSKSLQRLIKGR